MLKLYNRQRTVVDKVDEKISYKQSRWLEIIWMFIHK